MTPATDTNARAMLQAAGLHMWYDVRGYAHTYVPAAHPWRHLVTHRGGMVRVHRLMMALALGRPLTRRETVHHVNGRRHENRLTNLQLRHGDHGTGWALRCADCQSTNVEPVRLAGAVPPA